MDSVDDDASSNGPPKGETGEQNQRKKAPDADSNFDLFDSSDEEGQFDNDNDSDLESLTKGRGRSKKLKKGGRLRKGKIEKQKGKVKSKGSESTVKNKGRKEKKRERQDDFSSDEESDLDEDKEDIDEEIRELRAEAGADDLSSDDGEEEDGGRRRRKRRKVGETKPKKRSNGDPVTNINDDNFIDDDDDDQEITQEYRDQQEHSDGDDSYSDDPDDENPSSLRKGKIKKKNKIYKEKSVARTKEETEIDRALKAATSSKKKNVKMKPEQIEEYSKRVVAEMREASRVDKENYRNGRLAIAKMTALNKILPYLRNRDLHLRLLDEDHILDAIGEWIRPLPDNSLPAYNIRNELLKILNDLPCEVSHLRTTDIGKILKLLSKHPDETSDNKKICKEIIDRWLRTVVGRPVNNFRKPTDREDEEKRHRQNHRGKEKEGYAVLEPGQGKTSSDMYIPFNDNDLKIPMRAGFSFEVMPSMNHPSIRKKKSRDAPDEAMEILDPSQRESRGGKGNTRFDELKKKFRKR